MSRFGLRPSSCAAMLFIAASLGAQEPAMMAMNSRTQDLIKRFDKNGDGKIDDDERADAQEAMMKERIDKQVAQARVLPGGLEELRMRALERFDKNKDGMLDEEERAAALKFADERLAAGGQEGADLLRRLDKNNDGKVDEEERNAFRAMLAEARPLLPPPPLPSGTITTVNGERIDSAQMRETEKVIRVAIEADAAQRARFDKNTNGKLEDEEWQIARRQLGIWMSLNSSPSGLSPEAEQRRLKAVAEEVERRRKAREEAAGTPSNGTEKPQNLSAAGDQKRLETVADEVARRRKIREEAEKLVNGTPATPKQNK